MYHHMSPWGVPNKRVGKKAHLFALITNTETIKDTSCTMGSGKKLTKLHNLGYIETHISNTVNAGMVKPYIFRIVMM